MLHLHYIYITFTLQLQLQDNVAVVLSNDRLEIIPLVQGSLHLGVLCPLEHLVVPEVPVNKARVYDMSTRQC